jgi:long-chain acyl-CoA synthetase
MSWRQAEREYTDEVIGETTIPRLFFDAAERYPGTVCQRYKGGAYERSLVHGGVVDGAPTDEYADLTYTEVAEIVRRLATGFRELGLEPDDRVTIYADTRMEWCQADLAILSAGGVTTTVYTESSPPQVRYLLEDPGVTGVVVENRELLETVLAVRDELDLEWIVVMDRLDGDLIDSHDGDLMDRTAGDRDDVCSLATVHDLGTDAYDEGTFEAWLDERDWTDLASLVYTSGTTGDPKGVQLTHRNWRTALNQVRRRIGPRNDKPPGMPTIEHGKTALSFLPLAHAFERFNQFVQLGSGVTMAYAESTDTVQEDIETVQPESAASVPRVYERIFDSMRAEASDSRVGKRIFEWAVDVAQRYDEVEEPSVPLELQRRIADRLVFSQVREAMGGNVELFISGGGSLSTELAKLYRSMGLTILEGYGLTETAPVCTLNPPEDIRVGTMGPALPEIDYRLDESVVGPEQREGVDGTVGELLVRGPNVFDGYWNAPEKTAAAFADIEGEEWFRTGDVVAVDDEGYFTFVDRVKQLIVLDTGKNVAPEPIEAEFATSSRVHQIMVVGDDRKFVAAVVVPNFDALRDWADGEGADLPDDPAAVCDDERARRWVGEAIDRVNRGLGDHEEIKEFRLVPEEWTPDNDMLTPSMKMKRRNIVEARADELADIYGEEDEPELVT